LDWFKGQGKGYQSMINNVLRTYVNHQQNKALTPENYHSQDEDIILDSDIK
jgi:hypothetical protein